MTLQEARSQIVEVDYKLMQIHKGKIKLNHRNEYDNLLTIRRNLCEIKQLLENIDDAIPKTEEDYGL